MKGIVFTELIEMVEAKWGLAVADKLLQSEGLSSGGIYTAVGTYDDRDMGILLRTLGMESGMSGDELQRHFGEYIFGSFASGYTEMLKGFSSAFSLLSRLDDFIHPEVQKLYPDATLPGFEVIHQDENRMGMWYRSQRRMPHFAEGLMHAAAKHFGETISVEWELVDETEGLFRFEIIKKG